MCFTETAQTYFNKFPQGSKLGINVCLLSFFRHRTKNIFYRVTFLTRYSLFSPFLFLSSRLQEVYFKAPLCDEKRDEILFLDGDFSTAARFFLTVGVFAFLYCLLATIVYVFYQHKYLKNNRGPLVVSEFKPSTNTALRSQR